MGRRHDSAKRGRTCLSSCRESPACAPSSSMSRMSSRSAIRVVFEQADRKQPTGRGVIPGRTQARPPMQNQGPASQVASGRTVMTQTRPAQILHFWTDLCLDQYRPTSAQIGYRVSHDRGAVTVGNEAPVWQTDAPGGSVPLLLPSPRRRPARYDIIGDLPSRLGLGDAFVNGTPTGMLRVLRSPALGPRVGVSRVACLTLVSRDGAGEKVAGGAGVGDCVGVVDVEDQGKVERVGAGGQGFVQDAVATDVLEG